MIYAFDTETLPITPGRQAPDLVCLSYTDGTSAGLVSWREAENVAVSMLDSGGLIVGHNVAFDFTVLAAAYPRLLPRIFAAYEAGRVSDTGVRMKLIDIAAGCYEGFIRIGAVAVKIGYGLDDLARRLLGVVLDKTTYRLNYGALRDVPVEQWPEGARQYAIDDATTTLGIWHYQATHTPCPVHSDCNALPELASRCILGDEPRQVAAAFWLRLMSCWGIHTDPQAVANLERTARSEYARLARELVAAGLLRPDRVNRKGALVEGARITAAAGERLVAAFRARGQEAPATPTGKPRLDDATCRASGDPLLVAYAELSSLRKVLSTDVPMLAGGTVTPIHSRFEELRETGRTASSSPNIQNIRRGAKHEGGVQLPDIRECFVPRPGFVFVAADYSGLELRTWAQVCKSAFGVSRMAEVLNAGGDPHLTMAATILGCTYEDAKARYKAGEHDAFQARQTSKVGNFGFPGGLGAATMVEYAAKGYGVILTEDQTRLLKQQWYATWPEASPYLAMIGQLVDVDEPRIVQLFSGRVRGRVSYTEAANGFFQGLGADAAKAAGWLIARACYLESTSVLFGSRLVNFVHDEYIVESPESVASECADELARLMCLGAGLWLPDVPPKAEPVVMRRWSKKAESKRGADGRWSIWG